MGLRSSPIISALGNLSPTAACQFQLLARLISHFGDILCIAHVPVPVPKSMIFCG